MITHYLPYPANSGYPLRVYNLLYRIAREHQIWLATFIPSNHDPKHISHLGKFCQGIETAVLQNNDGLDRPMDALNYFIKGVPPDLRFYESGELAARIRHLTAQIDFDVVQIEDSHMSTYLDVLPKVMHPRTVLAFHDVNFMKYQRLIQLETKNTRKARLWLHSRMMRRWEPFYAERFGRCIAVSASDRDLLQYANPRLKIDVIPNGVDTNYHKPLADSNPSPAVIFVGNMGYRPNIDAAAYFCRDIYAKIQREFADLEMWIVGINPSRELLQLDAKCKGVHVTGCVEDVRPFYSRSAVCVVPVRAGGGTRLKILEAMALGRPVVSTSIGCEGLDVVDGEHLFIADTPDLFAEKTLSLLKDKGLRQRMISRARQLVVQRYDWEVISQQLLHIYYEISDGTSH